MEEVETLVSWVDEGLAKLCDGKTYDRAELREIFESVKADLRESAFRSMLARLVDDNLLYRLDHNRYGTVKPKRLLTYRPCYSGRATALARVLEGRYRGLDYIMSESVLLNEFLAHPIAENTIFVQVDRTRSMDVYEYLRKAYVGRVLYRPIPAEFRKEWRADCIVVLDMITQAPRSEDDPHAICVEKLLVDAVGEKVLTETFDLAELPTIFAKAHATYQIRRGTVSRYASRRGKGPEVRDLLAGAGIE